MRIPSNVLNTQISLQKYCLLFTFSILFFAGPTFSEPVNDLASDPLRFVNETFETNDHQGLQIVYGHFQSLKELAIDLERQGRNREAGLVRQEAVTALAKYNEIKKSSSYVKKAVVQLDKAIFLRVPNGLFRFCNIQHARPLKGTRLKHFFDEFSNSLSSEVVKMPTLPAYSQSPFSFTAVAQMKVNPMRFHAFLIHQTSPESSLFPLVIKALDSCCRKYHFERDASFLFSLSFEPSHGLNCNSRSFDVVHFMNYLHGYKSNDIFSQILCQVIDTFFRPK